MSNTTSNIIEIIPIFDNNLSKKIYNINSLENLLWFLNSNININEPYVIKLLEDINFNNMIISTNYTCNKYYCANYTCNKYYCTNYN